MIADIVSHDAFIFLWSMSVLTAATLAMGKARAPFGWLRASLLTGPIALLTLLRLPHSGHDPAASMEAESMDLCRKCLEPVRRDAPTCRYCGINAPVTPA